MLSKNRLSTLLVGGSAALLLTAAGNVSALDLYSQDGSKGKVVNSYGECWGTIGGRSDLCGSAPIAPAPAPVPVYQAPAPVCPALKQVHVVQSAAGYTQPVSIYSTW